MKKLYIVLLISLVLPCFAYADDTSLGRYGESVRPINNPNVRMESEKVNVKMYEGYSTTTCTFKFVNQTKKTQSLLMGFPDGYDFSTNDDISPESNEGMNIAKFSTVIDGKKIGVVHKKGKILNEETKKLDYPYWYTWEVTFKPGESKTVVNTYETQNTNDSMGYHYAGYVITTGSPWAGTIKDAQIVFDVSNFGLYSLESATPTNYKFYGDKLVWNFKNFEPTTNIEVVANKELGKILAYSTNCNDDVVSEAIDNIDELFSKCDYRSTINEADKVLAHSNITTSAINYFLTKKAIANIKLGKISDGVSNLERVVSSSQGDITDIGDIKPAAYYLLNYYKKHNIQKAKNIYLANIFMKTNGVLQKWVNEQVLNRSSSFFKPQLTNCLIQKDQEYFTIHDQDDDLRFAKVSVWYTENGKTKYLINETRDNFTQSHYEIGLNYGYTFPSNVKTLYYKVYAKDYSNNILDTGVKKVIIK